MDRAAAATEMDEMYRQNVIVNASRGRARLGMIVGNTDMAVVVAVSVAVAAAAVAAAAAAAAECAAEAVAGKAFERRGECRCAS